MRDGGTEYLTFTARDDRIEYLGERCIQHLSRDCQIRVLDLGCGTGAQIFYLLERLPLARFVGIDVSRESIASAQAEAERRGDDRASFVAADYLDWQTEPFDAILSDSVLQWIPVADDRLYHKIERDLLPHGRLLLSLPVDCLYNRVLWGLRWLMLPLRSAIWESFVLWVAGLIHPAWPKDLLRERIPYLFMLPLRYDGARMRSALTERHHLVLEADESLRWESPAKAMHRLIVYRKAGA